jgi:hypothetical protein
MRETDCRICVLDNLQASYAASVLFSVTLEPMPSLPEREGTSRYNERSRQSRFLLFCTTCELPFLNWFSQWSRSLKIPLKRRLTSSLTVVFLTAVLLLLAVLQYRWSNEVSKATTVRLRADLQTSLVGFRQGLYRELASACVPFQMSLRAGDPWTQFAEHYN